MRKPTTKLIDKWCKEGPVDLKVLEEWREEDGWSTWLPHSEEAFARGEKDLLSLIEKELSPVQIATLSITKNRLEGTPSEKLLEEVETAIELAKNSDPRDLILEGRLRMERGLAKVECGNLEEARDDLTWAETRLKSVAKASRDHDISMLNKAAFHVLVDEPLMALHVYSEIPRKGPHVPETVAFSRYGAAQICAHLGQYAAALRHSWVSYNLAAESSLEDLVWDAGTTFLAIGAESISSEALPMNEQVENAKPREVDEETPEAEVKVEEYILVFEKCLSIFDGNLSGPTRQDLMGILSGAITLERDDLIFELFSEPEILEDAFLIAALIQLSPENDREKWQKRLTDLMKISD